MRHAFLCSPVRTPIGRFAGGLSTVRTDDLAALPLRALSMKNPRLDWELVDDVILGCANQAGEDNRNIARMAVLLAGLPVRVPGITVNRLCGSGLQAVLDAAARIRTGDAELLIAGGVEGMSRAPYVVGKADGAFGRTQTLEDTTMGWRFVNPAMRASYGVETMPETAENVAAERSITRSDQDAFALRSHQRATAARERGRLAREIEPVTVRVKKATSSVAHDEQIRADTSLETLSKLPAPFRANGTVTAGNASGINDGAAAMIVASEEAITRHGLSPLARITGGAVAGVEPRLMGLGPVPATLALLARQNLAIGAFDVVELNEAFAAQALACLRALGLPDDAEHVNPNGGAIALGHPLGMSGARLAGSAALELVERGARRALVAMCIGIGQGIAISLERA
ncbi:3-oxoadipyl-CoA thiolase [Pendulispora rubella]|uniref:Beta-ketoadipyl-CoA thiolase n=1 Tax=Pendulispora rubella TaxID=2741070 RepID=A0ABZ2L6V1_9BACT